MEKLFDIITNIRTPLMLAGMVIAVLYAYLAKGGKNGRHDPRVVKSLFILAMTSIFLGFIGYIIEILPKPKPPPKPLQIMSKVHELNDLTRPVEGAVVSLDSAKSETLAATTNDLGEVKMTLPDALKNNNARIYATKSNLYEPMNPVNLVIQEDNDKIYLGLKRLQNPEILESSILPAAELPPESERRPVSGRRQILYAPLKSPGLSSPNPPPPPPPPKIDKDEIVQFSFMYGFEPKPGVRSWTRVSRNNDWIELYPDNSFSRFSFAGYTTIDGCKGIVLANDNDLTMEVFVPGKTCELLWTRFRRNNGQWKFLGEMKEIKP